MKRLNGMEMNNGGSMTVEEYIYDMLKCQMSRAILLCDKYKLN